MGYTQYFGYDTADNPNCRYRGEMYDEYPRREHHSHHRSRSYRKGSNIWRDAIRSRRKIFGVIGTLAIMVVLLIIALIVMIIIYVKQGSDNSTTTVSTSISSPTQTKKVRSIVFAYENPRYVSNNTTRRKRDTTTHEPSPAQTIRQFIEKQKEKEKDVETTYHIITFYEETKNFTGLFTEQALKILAENDNTTRKRTNPVQKKGIANIKTTWIRHQIHILTRFSSKTRRLRKRNLL